MITPENFFGGSWTGEGSVRGIAGRVIRTFEVKMRGAWSEPNRAFHTDEVVSYASGEVLNRHWVVHTDETGTLIGSDSLAGRLKVESLGDGFRIRYDRPRGIGGAPAVTSLTLDLRSSGPDRLTGTGVTRLLGFPLAHTRVEFRRATA